MLKFFVQGFEQLNVAIEFIEDSLHHVVYLTVQLVSGFLIAAAPANARAGEGVEQLAGRVGCLAEETLVLDHNLQNRNLQATDQHLNRGGQVVVIKDELEQHGDQIDQIFIHFIQCGLATILSVGLGQQLLNDLAQVDGYGLTRAKVVCFRPVLLKRNGVEHIRQFPASDHSQRGIGAAWGHAGIGPLQSQHLTDLVKQYGVFRALIVAGSRLAGAFGRAVCRCRWLLALVLLAVITEVRDNAGLDQNAIGFIQEHAQVGDHVTVKLLEQDEPFANLDIEGLNRFGKSAAQVLRCHRVDWLLLGGVRIDLGKTGLQLQ